MRLTHVQLLNGVYAHDPDVLGEPAIESQRSFFTAQQYDLTLADSVVLIASRKTSRVTLVHFASCRYAVASMPGPVAS